MLPKCCPKGRGDSNTSKMTTFKAEVGARRQDGTFNVCIRIIHNRQKRRVGTNIYIDTSQVTKGGKIKDNDVNIRIDTMLRRFREAAAEIEGADFLTVDELKNIVVDKVNRPYSFRLDFFAFVADKMKSMESKTAEGYRTSLNALKRFIKTDTLDINDITTKFVVDVRAFIENEPRIIGGFTDKIVYSDKGTKKGGRAVSFYLSHLRHIHNLARREYNDPETGEIKIPREPFKNDIIPPQPKTEHRALSVEQWRLIERHTPTNRREELARDMFLLSFYLVGINSIDLYQMQKAALDGDIITYRRAKTDSVRSDGAVISIRIEPEARPFFDKYTEKNRDDSHLFIFHRLYKSDKYFNAAVNKGLKHIAKTINADAPAVPEMLQYYHARHTWATLARNECGIERSTVHEALNHATRGAERVTDIYVKRDFSNVWKANRTVIDYLNNKV